MCIRDRFFYYRAPFRPTFIHVQAPLPLRYNARQPSHSGWSLIKTIVFFLAIACAGWLLFQRTVQNQLSHKVQDRVDQLLAGTDINASIQHASFVDGQGLKLRNVSVGTNATGSSLSSLNSSTSVIEIYEAFVRSPVSLPQLVAGNMPIQSVEIRRARLLSLIHISEPTRPY